MNSQKLSRNTLKTWLICVLSMSSGCAAVAIEPTTTNVKPKVLPLSETTLQAMQPDSTKLLKKADTWYENSGKLLDSVTNN